MTLNRTTKFDLGTKGVISVSPADHLATGGEGSVYRKGDLVVKLFADPERMLREGLADKITALSGLVHPYVVAPLGVVRTPQGKPVGTFMKHVTGEPLARVFTNDYRSRTGFGNRDAVTLAARMLEVLDFAHDHNAYLADANELNWLARPGPQAVEPRIIDVDSWAIGHWPATAMMPSIRDWSSPQIGQASDYFAWGVVTFQLFTGIHPYKGTLAGYKPGDLERRMKDGQSVFAPGIRLNRAVRPFGAVPGDLLDWYRTTFTGGRRIRPPRPHVGAPVAVARAARSTRVAISPQGTLRYTCLYDGADTAVQLYACGLARLASGALYDIDRRRVIMTGIPPQSHVIRLDDGWLVAWMDHDTVTAKFINAVSLTVSALPFGTTGETLVTAAGRLFLTTASGLTELIVRSFSRPILSTGVTWGVQIPSTRWFDGVGVQDSMGARYLIAPFGTNSCAQIRVPELDGLTTVAATAGHRFVTLIGLDATGHYRRVELTFDRHYAAYVSLVSVTDTAETNVAVLPTGVAASIPDDGRLRVFVPTTGAQKLIADSQITTDKSLHAIGAFVGYLEDGRIWNVRM